MTAPKSMSPEEVRTYDRERLRKWRAKYPQKAREHALKQLEQKKTLAQRKITSIKKGGPRPPMKGENDISKLDPRYLALANPPVPRGHKDAQIYTLEDGEKAAMDRLRHGMETFFERCIRQAHERHYPDRARL